MKLKIIIAIALIIFLISSCDKYETKVNIGTDETVLSTSYNNETIYITTYNSSDSIYRVYSNDKYGKTTLLRGFKILK